MGILLLMGMMPFDAGALGRLFFTPQERMALEENLGPAASLSGEKTPDSEVVANGWLHSGRRVRIWVDGKLVSGDGRSGRYRPDSGEIWISWRGRGLALKPGQTAVETPEGKIVIREFTGD